MFVDEVNRNLISYHNNSLNCKVSLCDKSLWQEFHDIGNEMIITKSGRRIFPNLKVQLENLDPNSHYCVLIEMVPISKCRYKYSYSGGWAPAGTAEAQSPNRVYLHPESPSLGHHWMSQIVSFGRLKLTNTANPPPGHLVLLSMHRYQPRIIVVKTSDHRQFAWAPHTSVSFPVTQFIAVTAYQNDKITQLKINNNPFAKGFRENGQSKCKRKRQQTEEEIEIVVVDDIKPEPKRIEIETPESSSCLDTSDDGSERTSSPEYSLNPYPSIKYPYNIPLYYHPCMYNSYYNPYSAPFLPQDLSLQKEEKPKKLTDFSITAIMGFT